MAKGSVGKGWSLVWRHQKILWWVFVVNLLTAFVATLGPRMMFNGVLDHSLASGKLANGFDVPTFVELISRPDVSMAPLVRGSFVMSLVFFVFMLFITGGMLVAYREDRRLSMGEFFEASGVYFWRMVRLVLMSLVPFALLAVLLAVVSGISSTLTDNAQNPKLGFYVMLGGYAVAVILALIVRLWFDVAQVRAVAQNEHAMFRNLMRSFPITFRDLPTLFWMYFRISLFGWIFLALGMYGWTRLTGNHVSRVFLLFEIVLFAQLLTRLWQRSASVSWYGEYAETHPAAAVEFTTPQPAELPEPAPRLENPITAEASAPQNVP
jgi:hypothetical protein